MPGHDKHVEVPAAFLLSRNNARIICSN